MKAEPAAQQRLLELQHHDLALDQAAHRRAHLPALAQIAEQRTKIAEIEQVVSEARAKLAEIDKPIKALEAEAEQVRARAERNRSRMESGAVPAKELTSMQHETDSLGARQSELEDHELELMEQREDVVTSVDDASSQRDTLVDDQAVMERDRDAEFSHIDAESAKHTAEREPLAQSLPTDLLALYERVRSQNAGIGAALLRSGRCGGCRLELSGTELAAIRSASEDDVVRCEECGRILVRTKESGL